MKLQPEQLARFVAEIPSAEWLAEHGYSGPQQYAYSITSDAYKDANGIRPRFLANASIEELAEAYYASVDSIVANEREEAEALELHCRKEAAELAAEQAALRQAVNPAPFGLQLSAIWPA